MHANILKDFFIINVILFLFFISDINTFKTPLLRHLSVDPMTGSTVIPLIPHVKGFLFYFFIFLFSVSMLFRVIFLRCSLYNKIKLGKF